MILVNPTQRTSDKFRVNTNQEFPVALTSPANEHVNFVLLSYQWLYCYNLVDKM